jgi:hypothetical protein
LGKPIGTIANEKGEFWFKIPNESDTVCISYLGYESFYSPVRQIASDLHVLLNPQVSKLSPVVISGNSSALEVVKSAIKRIPENYPENPFWIQSFYKQIQKEDDDTTEFEEAVINILFKGYTKANPKNDSIELEKAHVLIEVGPAYDHLNEIQLLFNYDFVKSGFCFFSLSRLGEYDFAYEGMTQYNGQLLYIISFDQNEDVNRPLYKGKMYIDRISLAIVKFEYTISPKGMKYWRWPWAFRVLEKKLIGAEDDWQQLNVSVGYEEWMGKWYVKDLHYFRRINRIYPKKGYACLYTWKLEAVVTKIDTSIPPRLVDKTKYLPRARRLSRQAGQYDSTFWKNYNVIK